MADTGKISAGLIAKLASDNTLASLMPDGVWFGVAPSNKTRFVVVSLSESEDFAMFNARAFEQLQYLVKAVELTTQPANAKAAAARIDALLDFQHITATGYTNVFAARARYVEYPETDDVNPEIKWQHCGGLYEVFAAP